MWGLSPMLVSPVREAETRQRAQAGRDLVTAGKGKPMNKTLVVAATLAGATVTTSITTAVSAQELTFWTWRQEDKAAYEEIFAAFTEANPGITVAFEAFEPTQYQTILSTALAGGSGPDIAHVRA